MKSGLLEAWRPHFMDDVSRRAKGTEWVRRVRTEVKLIDFSCRLSPFQPAALWEGTEEREFDLFNQFQFFH